jgi:hypothetical protein
MPTTNYERIKVIISIPTTERIKVIISIPTTERQMRATQQRPPWLIAYYNMELNQSQTVGDSHGGPRKQMGKPRLKPAKKPKLSASFLSTRGARPTPRWPPRPTEAAHSKVPSSRLRPARGHTPPSSGLRLARGRSARARPFPHAGTVI